MNYRYFPYTQLVDNIMQVLMRRRRDVVLVGAPGTGKSAIIEAISAELDGEALLLRGRSSAPVDLPAATTCLIDDLDVLLEQGVTQALQPALGTPVESRAPTLVTTTASTGALEVRARGQWSSLRRAVVFRVEPWLPGWRQALGGAVSELLPTAPAGAESWTRAIASLSDGHPTLIGAALDRLEQLAALGLAPCDEQAALLATRASLLDGGLPVLQAQLVQLLREEPETPEAWLGLLRGQPVEALPLGVAQRLVHRGLLACDHEQGSILRPLSGALAELGRELAGAEARPEEPPELTPASERLAEALRAACGELRDRRWLMERAGLDSKPAFDSALQRLREALARDGRSGRVENVRGAGYRLVDE